MIPHFFWVCVGHSSGGGGSRLQPLSRLSRHKLLPVRGHHLRLSGHARRKGLRCDVTLKSEGPYLHFINISACRSDTWPQFSLARIELFGWCGTRPSFTRPKSPVRLKNESRREELLEEWIAFKPDLPMLHFPRKLTQTKKSCTCCLRLHDKVPTYHHFRSPKLFLGLNL